MCVDSVLAREYQEALSRISPVVEEHRTSLVASIPQLNMCDVAVMVRFIPVLYISYVCLLCSLQLFFAPVHRA